MTALTTPPITAATASTPVQEENTLPSPFMAKPQPEVFKQRGGTVSDDTASTADESHMTASVASFAPPVTAISVDTRGVRQRMREQEARINDLLHSTHMYTFTSSSTASTSDDAKAPSEVILLKLVKTLEEDVKKTEAEKQKLQDALEQLQAERQNQLEEQQEEVDAEESVKAAPVSTSAYTSVDQESSRVAQLKEEVRRKTIHISLLQERWETTLRQMVAYQHEAETHDLHYTQYAAQRMADSQEALLELKELTSKSSPKEDRNVGKKAKQMMAQLLTDLESLSHHYQEVRVAQEQQKVDWKVKLEAVERRADYLQKQLEKAGIPLETICEDEESGETPTMGGPLMKFHAKLRLQQAAAELRENELRSKLEASGLETQQAMIEKDVVEKEMQRLQETVSKLEGLAVQQQDALQASQAQVLELQSIVQQQQQEATNNKKKQRKLFSFGKKSKTLTINTATMALPASLAPVDMAAILALLKQESRRFDVLHERMQQQRQALLQMQTDVHQTMKQKAHLEHTVAELRVQQAQTAAAAETNAVIALQDQLSELERKREKEQQATRNIIQRLQARVKSLEG